MPYSSRHTLLQALTISLLIHGALLLTVDSDYPLHLNGPATRISVVVNRNSHADPEKTVSTPVTKPLTRSVKPSSPVVRKDTIPQIVVPARAPVPAIAQPPALQATHDAALQLSAAGGAAHAGSVPESAREAISADDIRQYRMSLGTAARRFKRYPALARERGWEGAVEVALNINAHSPLPQVLLVRSSGRSALDEQAVETMSQAARATTLPEGLKGRDIRVPLSIRFSLEDDQ